MASTILTYCWLCASASENVSSNFINFWEEENNECLPFPLHSPALLGEESDAGRVATVQGVGQGCALLGVSQVAVHAQLQQWLYTVGLPCSCSPVQRCPGEPHGKGTRVRAQKWHRVLSWRQLFKVWMWHEKCVAIYSVEMVSIRWGFRRWI